MCLSIYLHTSVFRLVWLTTLRPKACRDSGGNTSLFRQLESTCALLAPLENLVIITQGKVSLFKNLNSNHHVCQIDAICDMCYDWSVGANAPVDALASV